MTTNKNPYIKSKASAKSSDAKKAKGKVVVAMSGGVDSSVAAVLLKNQGYEVVGMALQVTDYSKYRKDDSGGTCCSIKDMEDARRVAESIKIPFYVLDTEKIFDSQVVDYFITDYLQGRTPNPCVMCNTKVKFNQLYRKALDMDADFIATGHYAKVTYEPELGYSLWRADDEQKDQSYFLFNLTQRQLERTLFPLGNLTKPEVRKIAEDFKLPVAVKPDSQEICFVPGNDYSKFIESRTAETLRRRGFFVYGKENTVLGEHGGIHKYTLGQRKGLGEALDTAKRLGLPDADNLFVLKIDPIKHRVILGSEKDLQQFGLLASRVNWIVPPDLRRNRIMQVKVRYRAQPALCEVRQLGDSQVEVRFAEAQRAITPGQACVFYDGNLCLGGGWIQETIAVSDAEIPKIADRNNQVITLT